MKGGETGHQYASSSLEINEISSDDVQLPVATRFQYIKDKYEKEKD